MTRVQSIDAEAGLRRARLRRFVWRRRVVTTIAMIAIAILVAYFLFPIWWQIVASTKTTSELASTNGFFFSSELHVVDNLVALFTMQDGIFARWLLNSAIYSVGGGLVATIISGAAGYAMAMLRFRGSRVSAMAVLVGTMVPATVLAFPVFLVVTGMGLNNTYWAVLLPSFVNPFSVFLVRMFAAQSIPRELLESARVDGAGEIRIAVQIGSRLMVPGLVTVFLIEIVAIWNNFFLPLLVLNSQGLYPSTLGLYIWNTHITQVPELQSLVLIGSLVTSIPLIVLFLVLQRYWRAGIAVGAVKG